MQQLLRACLFFATFLMVVMAIVQVSGRVAFAFLDRAEPRINSLLAGRSITLDGLQGTWRYLNPGVYIDAVRLPAGELRGVTLELDVLESLRRSQLVLTRGYVAEGEVALEWVDGRWQLRDMPPAGPLPFDLAALLWQSDALVADVQVTLMRADDTAAYVASVRATNRGGGHGAQVTIAGPSTACDDCTLRLIADFRDAVPFVRPASRRLRLEAERFDLPLAVLTGLPGARGSLRGMHAVWQDEAAEGAGAVAFTLDDVSLGGSQSFSVLVDLAVVGSETRMQAAATHLELRTGSRSAPIDGLLVEARAQGVHAYLPMLDITALSPLAQDVTAGVERAGEWLQALDLKGRADDLRLSVERGEGRWLVAYEAQLSDMAMQAYKGAPTVRDGAARVFGAGPHLVADVLAPAPFMHLPEVFSEGWQLAEASGRLEALVTPGYFAMRGSNLDTRLRGTQVHGSFALAQPKARYDKHLTLNIRADTADVQTGQSLVPYKLGSGLARWLQEAPRGGGFEEVAFAYQGQIHAPRGVPARRVALRSRVIDARVRFHDDWPEVAQVHGTLYVSGADTMVQAARGTSLGVAIDGSEVAVRNNGALVDVALQARGDGERMLEFVRGSALRQRMPFVTQQWQAGGEIALSGRVQVPLGQQTQEPGPEVQLQAKLAGVALHIPEFRARFRDLRGSVDFSLPHGLRAQALTGYFWEHPMKARIGFDDQAVQFDLDGRLDAERTFAIIGMDDPGLLQGAYDFAASLRVAADAESVTSLQASSDLTGMEVLAPAGVGKTAEQAVATTVALRFLETHIATEFSYGTATGWLHIEEAPVRGAIGLAQAAPVLPAGEDVVLIGGHLPSIDIAQWAGGDQGGLHLPFTWRIDGLSADVLTIEDFAVQSPTLHGGIGAGGLAFEIRAADMAGHVMLPDSGPMDINLDLLRLPSEERQDVVETTPAADPLPAGLVATLPEAHVRIDRVLLGEDEFGRWEFDVRRRSAEAVVFENLAAEVKGVQIAAPAGIVWNGTTSVFDGQLNMVDLANVLPQWGYAPTLSSAQAVIVADVSWPGSPLNVALLGLTGDVRFDAQEGRFVEVEAGGGALRIMSLLNFSALIKRLNLNFSDVVGKGLSYETVSAAVRLEAGRLTFTDPLHVDSTSSEFRIGGTVDLVHGVLDNEMVVTLPLTRGLPWYGVYVGLANPLAGLGVLLGERVLRKPLQQISTAKYAVRGTLDDPDVRFVELFNTRMSEPAPAADVPAEQDAG